MGPLKVNDLLLAPELDRQTVADLLRPYGLRDPVKADANLQAIAANPAERHLLSAILQELLDCVSRSADPDQALTYLERFSSAALNKSQLLSYLRSSPQAMEVLIRCLGGSPYMSEILIRDPQLFYWVSDPGVLHHRRRKREIQREIIGAAKALPSEQQRLDYLRSLKRREMLHIGVRDVLRVCSVEDTWIALSVLAEALISAAYWICASAVRKLYGIKGRRFTEFTVLAMGKLGGGELNFSSDVDLMYLYSSQDEEIEGVAAADFFRRLSQKLTLGLNNLTAEGYVYRVDLRLRPEGKAGNLADPFEGYQRYYKTRLGNWERLALIKASPVAGDRALGRRFLEMAEGVIYSGPLSLEAVRDILDMKRKIEGKAAARGHNVRNVKLGTGGIREVELIAQSLQASHGDRHRNVRERNTLKALKTLRNAGMLSAQEFETLADAYVFLRDVENKLQMLHDAQTHSLPAAEEELAVCSRLLGYVTDESAGTDVEQFLRDYERHTSGVNAIFRALLGKPDLERLR